MRIGPVGDFAVAGREESRAIPRNSRLGSPRDSDATVWFGDPTSPGGKAPLRVCRALGRPVFLIEEGVTRPSQLTTWLVAHHVEVLNVAGNRETTPQGIGEWVERFLVAALRCIA